MFNLILSSPKPTLQSESENFIGTKNWLVLAISWPQFSTGTENLTSELEMDNEEIITLYNCMSFF